MAVCLHSQLTRRFHPDLKVWEAVVECLECGQWRLVKLKATFGPFRLRRASAGTPVLPSPGSAPVETRPEEDPGPTSPDGIGEPIAARDDSLRVGGGRKETRASAIPPPPASKDPIAHLIKCPACGHKVYSSEVFKTREMLKEKDICQACAIAFPQLVHPSELQHLMDSRTKLGLTKVG